MHVGTGFDYIGKSLTDRQMHVNIRFHCALAQVGLKTRYVINADREVILSILLHMTAKCYLNQLILLLLTDNKNTKLLNKL